MQKEGKSLQDVMLNKNNSSAAESCGWKIITVKYNN